MTERREPKGRASGSGKAQGSTVKGSHPEMDDFVRDQGDIPLMDVDDVAPDSALTEGYNNQQIEDMKANRKMRWAGFISLAIACGIFLIFFLVMLTCLLWADGLAGIMGAIGDGVGWHGLVFLTALIVITAAIPLSLAAAMGKILSPKNDDGIVKTPGVEAIKAIAELVNAAKG